jgi:hypothetical protein
MWAGIQQKEVPEVGPKQQKRKRKKVMTRRRFGPAPVVDRVSDQERKTGTKKINILDILAYESIRPKERRVGRFLVSMCEGIKPKKMNLLCLGPPI